MKQKSKLRAFLALAGSSLLAVNPVSAGTYYWDSDGDGTLGFGATAGTWNAAGTGNLWSTSPTGDGVGGAAVANYATVAADDLYFGTGFNVTSAATTNGDATVTCASTANLKAGMTVTGTGIPASATVASITDSTTFVLSASATATNTGLTLSAALPFTGATTINGTVLAGRVYQQSSHPTFVAGTAPKIDFGTAGIYESSNTNRDFPLMEVTGTQLTWKSVRNLTINNVTSTVGKTILSTASEATISYPARIKMKAETNLGATNAPLVFDHGTLSLQTGFPYTSLSALHAAHPVSFVANKNAGLDNSTGLSGPSVTFTVDLPIDLGTGVFYTETSGGTASIIKLTSTGSNWSEVRMTSGILEISDLAQLGPNTAPLRFGAGTSELGNGTLRITGTSLTSFGTKPLLTTSGKGVSFEIADAANTFTVDQTLDQGTGAFSKSGPGSLTINATSTYTGLTSVLGGKLSYGSAAGLPTGAVTVNGADAVLDFGAFSPTLTTLTLTTGSVSGTGTVTATGIVLNNAVDVSLPVKLAGAAAMTKTGAGTATLSGTNTYSGSNAVNGGSITVEGTQSGGGGWSIGSGAAATALTFAAGSTISVDAGKNVATTNGAGSAGRAIVVAGSVTSSSTSDVTIWGRNSISINNGGSWNMQGGTLTVQPLNSGYSATLNVNAGGSFTYGGTNTIVVSKATSSGSGSGSLNLKGTFTTTTGFRNTSAGTNSSATSNFNFDGGTLKISNDIATLFASGGQPFNISLGAGGGTINTNGFNTATSLGISGTGGLTKAGGGTLTLSGTNTYAGNTTVTGGTLVLAAANAANNASTVTISGSGSLQLNYTGTDTVDKLFIGTTQKAAGQYGKVGSASPIIGIPEITGDGTLTVTSSPTATPFELFMASYPSLTGSDALPDADPDGDGKSNKFEFAFKGNPTSGSDDGMVAGLVQDASAPAGNELTLIVAVRDGATFTSAGSPAVQTATVDGVTYTVEGTLDLTTFPGSAVSHASGPSNTAPPSSGLPDLTGTGWEYHAFKLDASEGLSGRGFLRAKAQ